MLLFYVNFHVKSCLCVCSCKQHSMADLLAPGNCTKPSLSQPSTEGRSRPLLPFPKASLHRCGVSALEQRRLYHMVFLECLFGESPRVYVVQFKLKCFVLWGFSPACHSWLSQLSLVFILFYLFICRSIKIMSIRWPNSYTQRWNYNVNMPEVLLLKESQWTQTSKWYLSG